MFRRFRKWGITVSGIALFIFTLVGIANILIFLSVLSLFWRPDTVPVPITSDVALGMHLQLFEAILAALAIGLAVFGFVGYAAIKDAAERRADDTARQVMQTYARFSGNNKTSEEIGVSQEPNLAGLPEKDQQSEPEEKI